MRKSPMSVFKWMEIGIWTAVIVVFFVASFDYNRGFDVFTYGTATWPRALLILMALAVLGQLFEYRRGTQAEKTETGELGSVRELMRRLGQMERRSLVRLIGTFAIPIAYLLLLPGAGFYVLTPFFIAAYLVNAGEKRPWHIIGASLGIYVALTVIFTRYLYVGLPLGNWPGFYDVSSALVGFLSPM